MPVTKMQTTQRQSTSVVNTRTVESYSSTTKMKSFSSLSRTSSGSMLEGWSFPSLALTDSPQEWVPGNQAVFLMSNSPSPQLKVTRRSSVYERSPAPGKDFKAPLPAKIKVISSPVSTRTRRSSIYKKGSASAWDVTSIQVAQEFKSKSLKGKQLPKNKQPKSPVTVKTSRKRNMVEAEKEDSPEKPAAKRHRGQPATTKPATQLSEKQKSVTATTRKKSVSSKVRSNTVKSRQTAASSTQKKGAGSSTVKAPNKKMKSPSPAKSHTPLKFKSPSSQKSEKLSRSELRQNKKEDKTAADQTLETPSKDKSQTRKRKMRSEGLLTTPPKSAKATPQSAVKTPKSASKSMSAKKSTGRVTKVADKMSASPASSRSISTLAENVDSTTETRTPVSHGKSASTKRRGKTPKSSIKKKSVVKSSTKKSATKFMSTKKSNQKTKSTRKFAKRRVSLEDEGEDTLDGSFLQFSAQKIGFTSLLKTQSPNPSQAVSPNKSAKKSKKLKSKTETTLPKSAKGTPRSAAKTPKSASKPMSAKKSTGRVTKMTDKISASSRSIPTLAENVDLASETQTPVSHGKSPSTTRRGKTPKSSIKKKSVVKSSTKKSAVKSTTKKSAQKSLSRSTTKSAGETVSTKKSNQKTKSTRKSAKRQISLKSEGEDTLDGSFLQFSAQKIGLESPVKTRSPKPSHAVSPKKSAKKSPKSGKSKIVNSASSSERISSKRGAKSATHSKSASKSTRTARRNKSQLSESVAGLEQEEGVEGQVTTPRRKSLGLNRSKVQKSASLPRSSKKSTSKKTTVTKTVVNEETTAYVKRSTPSPSKSSATTKGLRSVERSAVSSVKRLNLSSETTPVSIIASTPKSTGKRASLRKSLLKSIQKSTNISMMGDDSVSARFQGRALVQTDAGGISGTSIVARRSLERSDLVSPRSHALQSSSFGSASFTQYVERKSSDTVEHYTSAGIEHMEGGTTYRAGGYRVERKEGVHHNSTEEFGEWADENTNSTLSNSGNFTDGTSVYSSRCVIL